MRSSLFWLFAAAVTLPMPAGAEVRASHVQAATPSSLREWSDRVDWLLASRELVVRQAREDTMIPGRQHERLAQFYAGVPVFGGELVRQSDRSGTLTVFGTFYEGIDLDVSPRLAASAAERAVAGRGGRPFGTNGGPQLVVLPLDSSYRLAYRVRALFTDDFDLRQCFFDANTGQSLLEYGDLKTQAAGLATGVLGDKKKISVMRSGSYWLSKDELRPPMISTYDFRFDLNRLLLFFASNGSPWSFTTQDLALDDDNVWTDGAVVDAHVYAGYTYDYYYKRHGRRGLDDANISIHSVTHAFRREDWLRWSSDTVNSYFANAAYFGDGVMYYGDGLPPGVTFAGRQWNYLAGGLDVVAHELTHGVTEYTSNLIYHDESGALNEAFSDIMGTSVEFMFQPQKADYLLAEDVVTPGGLRSMQSPMSYGDPDHYSIRYTGTRDYGGVHTNSGIANNAFYLAIEGGTHRLGRTVQGVGGANREQIERVFYRGFTSFLPPSATFAQARAATVQAARELYGPGSPAERAVTQAWTAVGVD